MIRSMRSAGRAIVGLGVKFKTRTLKTGWIRPAETAIVRFSVSKDHRRVRGLSGVRSLYCYSSVPPSPTVRPNRTTVGFIELWAGSCYGSYRFRAAHR